MEVIITNEEGKQVSQNIPLHMSNIKEVCYEEMFSKSGDDQSYFSIYINTPLNEIDKLSWLESTIALEYVNINDKILPMYEERFTSCVFYLNEETTNYNLTNDEQLMLVSVCVKAFLENYAYSNWSVLKEKPQFQSAS